MWMSKPIISNIVAHVINGNATYPYVIYPISMCEIDLNRMSKHEKTN